MTSKQELQIKDSLVLHLTHISVVSLSAIQPTITQSVTVSAAHLKGLIDRLQYESLHSLFYLLSHTVGLSLVAYFVDENRRTSRCVGGLCWVCESVCVETGVCRTKPPKTGVLSAGRIPIAGRAPDPRAFLQRQGLFMWGKVLRGGGGWEEWALLRTCQVGQWSAINQKSKQRLDTGYSEVYAQLQHLPMPHRPLGFLSSHRKVEVTRPEWDIITHLQ